MLPERLPVPHPDHVLLRKTDQDDCGLALYELRPHDPNRANPLLVFDAPSDNQAQDLVLAWTERRQLLITYTRLRWKEKLARKCADRQARWLESLRTPDLAAQVRALEEYEEAERRAEVLAQALFGPWPA